MTQARTALRWIFLTLIIGTVALLGAPRLFEGTTLTVLTGSMRPLIDPGDVVAVIPVDAATLKPGDIVTFQPDSDDPSLITHRIKSITEKADGELHILTRGDANNVDDEKILAEQIMGKVYYHVPLVGLIGEKLAPLVPALVIISVVVLIGGWGISQFRPTRVRKPQEAVQ